MGCASSKGNKNSSTTAVSDDNQPLINEQFRQWLKSNRPKADEYVLNDVISTAEQSNDINDYRTIVSKALDLLSERHDIKTTNKLGKVVQKEVSSASPKKVAHTIDILKQTAEKLCHGEIILDNSQTNIVTNSESEIDANTSELKSGQISSSEPGINLKDALEKARVLFYKGKQAAIFANPSGGYLVKVIDDNDDASLNQDGNLLRSIIVTEVKMRPKPAATTHKTKFSEVVPPPPPPSSESKLLNDNEIGDDFRRSIDAALKGLEAIYQTSPNKSSGQSQDAHVDKISSSNESKLTSEVNVANSAEMNHEEKVIKSVNDEEQNAINQIDIQPKIVTAIDDMNEIMLDIIETTTESEIGNPVPSTTVQKIDKLTNVERIVKEVQEHGEINELKNSLPSEQSPINVQDHVASIQNEECLVSSIDEQQIKSSFEKEEKTDDNKNNINNTTNFDNTSSSCNQIEQDSTINNESSIPAVSSSNDTNTIDKVPSHNITYTEIIHSESRDGEQTRRFITESYDDHPSKNNDETTTLKVLTKSEFSNDPSSGEKIMEQSVQVITVKVRNETTTERHSSPTSDNNDISNDKESIKNDVSTSTDITN